MILQFLCPNGHKVHCSEERAGQAAKCPRCGVKFRIPTIEEIQPIEAQDVVTGSSVKVGSGSVPGGPVSGILLGAATSPDQIEFLCPNDHLLHGPASSQGQPGQCPECGSKFRIPTYPDQTETPSVITPSGSQAPETVSPALVAGPGGGDTGSGAKLDFPLVAPALEAGSPGGAHPVANLVARLWAYKSQGATIELRYGDGHRLTPDQFIPGLTTPSHGVFAVVEPNGTYTVTAVAWDKIQVVIARGVKRLPREPAG